MSDAFKIERVTRKGRFTRIGDKVEYLGNIGTIGCIHDDLAFRSRCKNQFNGKEFKYPSGGICEEHKTFMGYSLDGLEKIN